MEAESMIKQENSNRQILMDDDTTHVVIAHGPPASRTVIDNLKKLLTQRQHSRESDAENKEVVPSTGSDLESELSFYSLLTSSTSDSDLDFLHTSPDNRKSKRRPKRNLSTSSSSSSSSLSPVRERRKRPKTSKRGVKRYDSQMIILEDWSSQNVTSKKGVTPRGVAHRHSPISQLADNPDPLTGSGNIVNINIMMNPNVKFDDDPENQSSSNKESTTDEEDQGIANMDSTGKNNGSNRGSGTRLRKTRRDRNKRRRHYHHHHHHHHHSHGGRIRCGGSDNHRHQLHNSTSNIDMIIGSTTDSLPVADIPNPTSCTEENSAAINEVIKTDASDSPKQPSNTAEPPAVEKI